MILPCRIRSGCSWPSSFNSMAEILAGQMILGGYSTLGTLSIFDTDNSVVLKEKEVNFLIDRQYLHRIEEP